MTLAWPQLLWLLLLPAACLVWEFRRRRDIDGAAHSKILRAEAGRHSLRLVTLQSQPDAGRHRIRPWLWLGLAFAIVASARPQWGRLEEPIFDQAREILIAIDLSRSMLTPDVKPSRLERAKLLTQSLLEKLAGERVGLVVFSGTAFLQSPLSADYEILREFLPALNPEFLPEGGTNYRALIETAMDAFGSTSAADRFLVVLSDGEATTDDWRERVPELKTKGIRVIGLGIGTTAGAMIPDGSGGLVKDERGAVVLSKLESGTLRELAEKTTGVYQDASNWIDVAELVNATVESGRKGEFTEKNTIRLVERFQWPLGLALWLLMVSFYFEFPVRPKPRNLKITTDSSRPKTPAVSATAALLLMVLLAFTDTVPALAAGTEKPAAPPPLPLATIVGRLSAAENHSARDWAELGRETVRWGSKQQSAQQPVPEGPVRDALAAVDLGVQLDAKTADWPKLREELEALLKKPEEQKKDDKQDQPKQDEQQNKSDSSKDQQKHDQPQKQEDQRQNDPSQKENDSSEPEDPAKDKPAKDNASKPQDQKQKDEAFGKMEDQAKSSPAPSQPPEDTQKVGGAPKKEEGEQPPLDPSLALPLQKLDQLRNQDSPAELFKLMEGDKDRTPRKKTKDW